MLAPGPMERAWLIAGCAAAATADLDWPEVLHAEGEAPVLLYPARYDATQRELCFGWAMPTLFARRYGLLAVLRAMANAEAIAAIMREHNPAAD